MEKKFFYRIHNGNIYHAEVTYVAPDLKNVHITGTKLTDSEGAVVPETDEYWVKVEGQVSEYPQIEQEINGETYVAVTTNRRLSRWRKEF